MVPLPLDLASNGYLIPPITATIARSQRNNKIQLEGIAFYSPVQSLLVVFLDGTENIVCIRVKRCGRA
jgi:hypothetical protein